MGITNTANDVSTTNVRYSAFLGMLYVSSTENEALIKAAKIHAGGESEVKKGFQGNKGDSPSAKAIALLREKGVTPCKVSGVLTGARVIERDVEGRKTPYLNVSLKDEDGRYYISIALAQSGAQMLARKMVNAEPGVETEIIMFATYGQKEGATRAYANHGATVRQHGKEVVSLDPKGSLVPQVNAATKALKDAGVDDKETIGKRRQAVELQFHLGLMTKVEQKFSDFYATREIPANGHEAGTDEVPFADESDDIPF
jgi:hypothetical protein